MRRVFQAAAIAILIASGGQIAWAQDLDKGQEAHVAGDYETALKELRPLAKEGNADAQLNLGVMYYYGQGVIQDNVYAHMCGTSRHPKATKLPRTTKAAEQGPLITFHCE